ncbi:MAG: nickel pincer cofactor biosynthesis protein LarB [Lautropia sp.]
MIEQGIRIDRQREERLGFDEAVYAAGKSSGQLNALIADAVESRGRRLFTRLGPAQFEALAPAHRRMMDYDPVSCTGIVGALGAPIRTAQVGIVTGGSSDLPVALEAARTLQYHGHAALQIADVGVAGLWRLLERAEELRPMSVLIVVAGMEGALFSVVGGLLPAAIIALPTSVGYGVSQSGRVALQSALASCAPGIVTVNTDNGYGAACAALRILRPTARE